MDAEKRTDVFVRPVRDTTTGPKRPETSLDFFDKYPAPVLLTTLGLHMCVREESVAAQNPRLWVGATRDVRAAARRILTVISPIPVRVSSAHVKMLRIDKEGLLGLASTCVGNQDSRPLLPAFLSSVCLFGPPGTPGWFQSVGLSQGSGAWTGDVSGLSDEPLNLGGSQASYPSLGYRQSQLKRKKPCCKEDNVACQNPMILCNSHKEAEIYRVNPSIWDTQTQRDGLGSRAAVNPRGATSLAAELRVLGQYLQPLAFANVLTMACSTFHTRWTLRAKHLNSRFPPMCSHVCQVHPGVSARFGRWPATFRPYPADANVSCSGGQELGRTGPKGMVVLPTCERPLDEAGAAKSFVPLPNISLITAAGCKVGTASSASLQFFLLYGTPLMMWNHYHRSRKVETPLVEQCAACRSSEMRHTRGHGEFIAIQPSGTNVSDNVAVTTSCLVQSPCPYSATFWAAFREIQLAKLYIGFADTKERISFSSASAWDGVDVVNRDAGSAFHLHSSRLTNLNCAPGMTANGTGICGLLTNVKLTGCSGVPDDRLPQSPEMSPARLSCIGATLVTIILDTAFLSPCVFKITCRA
ncbi:uncharacterized protein CLUP02_03769 [Colletotrichum lupini]|uniref:Uncharacterized protein n=1 Tax=Colletotrichum lupini TaxID=145971 RepID=A0A9Q8WD20_9PEZI|nr:uncharacterized protein CLUP02_03769 [Colletotrichum lupini]UQC78292.1 hypothetical protein CLUP02_03769 [Colletotrichum lupini]